MPRLVSSGLYVITDSQLIGGKALLPAVEAALRGGAGMVQYRDKSANQAQRFDEASGLAELCRHAAVPLIINDDIALAKAVGADGVHLGRDDAAATTARAELGPQAIIGISGYNQPEAALAAEADYIALGRLF
ncbi:MAG: thiamine phosphate synthase, partial [Nevskiales bacterium]